MRIGIDLDEVLFPYFRQMRRYLVHEEGFPEAQIGPSRAYSPDRTWGLPEGSHLEALGRAVKTGFYLRGQPDPEALAALGRLRRRGHDLIVITSRLIPGVEAEAVAQTEDWVDRHLADLVKEVHVVRDKADALPPVALHLDDLPRHLAAMNAAHGTVGYLWDRPWNRRATRWPRVRSWDDFTTAVRSYRLP